MTVAIRFDDGTASYWLGSRGGEGPGSLSEREARGVLARWLMSEPWRTQLRRFAAQELRVEARTDDALVDRMCAVLEARGLTLSRRGRMSLEGPSPRLAPTGLASEPLQAVVQEDTTHWIHVIVVDQDDQPLSGVRYRLELTDGRVREGRTDADGAVYVDEIPAGECELSLLEYSEQR